jgi:hypothetical protein
MTPAADRVSRPGRRLGAVAAGAALVGLSTLVAHHAAYLTTTASAAAYSHAMSSSGHDATWLPFVSIVLVAAVVLVASVAWRLLRLGALAGDRPSSRASADAGAYARVVLVLWCRLAAATFLAFATLENVERGLAGLTLPGMDALVVHGPVPVLSILGSSLVVAAVAGLVRWRTLTLIARIPAQRSSIRRPASARRPVRPERRPARPWTAYGASRAPPRMVPTI